MVILLGMPSGSEWFLVFLVVLLLFGGKKIPELLRGLGKGIREFNKAREKVRESIHEGMQEDEEEESHPLPRSPKESISYKKGS